LSASGKVVEKPECGEFGARRHLKASRPFELTAEHMSTLSRLGGALRAFYAAADEIYLRGDHAWVCEYLDLGKPEELIRHSRMRYQRRALPAVIRPDILITESGFSITELDSVPGGIGHLDMLSAHFERQGFDLTGGPRGMRDGFAQMLRSASNRDDPVCAIVISEESADYRPEMEYLASELRGIGLSVVAIRPEEITFTEEGLYAEFEGVRRRIDLVYRFFELFDLRNVPKSELIAYAAKKKLVTLTPPYKPHLEEKMLLALLHSQALADYWLSALGNDDYSLLIETTAPTCIMDPRPVPPHAEISGFRWRDRPIRDWREVANGTQKQRRFALKPSGFSPIAWGSRGVRLGHDVPSEEWSAAVESALDSFENGPWVLQPFRDTKLFRVQYEIDGQDGEMEARVRLCPYYFVVGDETSLGGVLATACPKDKKLIHGMTDAVMCPCALELE